MVSISLCMIVKNEEMVLERCLESIHDLVDEIIIVDTGSTDDTKSIAAKYTRLIYDFSWVDDFSKARNFAFSKATGDYIYSCDADEVLDDVNRNRFLQLKEVLMPEVEIVQMKYVENGLQSVLNSNWEYRPKLYKRLRTFKWIDPIHETVRTEPVVFDSDIEILHMPESLPQSDHGGGGLYQEIQHSLRIMPHGIRNKSRVGGGDKQGTVIEAVPDPGIIPWLDIPLHVYGQPFLHRLHHFVHTPADLMDDADVGTFP